MNKWLRLGQLLPLLCAVFAPLAPAQAEEFLDPEVAFKFSARALDSERLEARWQIADGYYMYRDKFRFEVGGATLGKPELPRGKMKDDDTFGRVETYRRDVRIVLPIAAAPGATAVTLTAVSQGCADAGLCYTPQTERVSLKLPAAPQLGADAAPAASIAPAATRLAALDSLGALGGERGMPKLLPPDEAFLVAATLADPETVRVDFTLTPDTYLYRDKIGFVVKSPADVKIARVDLPAGDVKDDPTFGRTEVYHAIIAATVQLSRPLGSNESLTLEAAWQGCNEAVGVCYPPSTRDLVLGAGASGAGESDTSRIERLLRGGSFWAIVVTFFGIGLLLALTPCVFPMIPILSGIIAGQNRPHTKTSGFLLSLAYVLGMALTYAVAGVAAALSGTLLSNALQNPWALSIGAGVFVVLALSMFGFFEIQLPSALQSRFTEASNRMKGGQFAGVFAMGALSAVILGPCVAPPLAAALAFIAQTGNTLLGGIALFVLALGMGVPLLLVGVSAGALLPRAGGWMNAVKYFFGVLMLAIAIYLIAPVIPDWVGMLLWALLLIGSAIYLHALDPLPAHASGWAKLWKGLGVALLIGGLALIVGMLAGSRDVLQPLDVFKGGSGTAAAAEKRGLAFEKVAGVAELDARLAQARADGRPVMLDFYADWCVSCKEFDRFTFSDPRVQARLADVVLLKADVTANNEADKALLKRFSLFGPPAMIFWNARGEQSDYKVIGFEKPDRFLESLDAAIGR